MVLYCLAYNNYYNRQVKKEDALEGYLPFLLSDAIQGVNFNPNDGVNTIQVINWKESQLPNYIVCVDDLGNIHSRWFVLDAPRLRNGQYNLSLRRDLFVDYYDPIITAPCFIEKATVDDSDPAIYNSENMTFNQIKTSETLLKDMTNCPWIVGYFARTTGDEEQTITTLNGTTRFEFPADIKLNGDITSWEYYTYTDNNPDGIVFKTNPEEIEYQINYLMTNSTFRSKLIRYFVSKQTARYDYVVPSNPDSLYPLKTYNELTQPTAKEVHNKINYNVADAQAASDLNYHSLEESNAFRNLNGKIIETFDGTSTRYYRINISDSEYVDSSYFIPTIGVDIFPLLCSYFELDPNTIGYQTFAIRYKKFYRYKIKLTEEIKFQTRYDITNSRYHLNDAPYDMFAIPFGDNIIIKNTGDENWNDIQSNRELAFSTAMSIAQKYHGGGVLYDIQLLPYCPVRSVIIDNNVIDLNNDNDVFSRIIQNEETVGVILNASTSSFTFDITLENPIIITNKKQQSLCDMYRLCSPNYNGVFEFNAAENDGIQNFNVDCTYIPFNPYIHINPNFKGLYGKDFDDSRGLIVGGEFSLPIVTDQWETYKLNNKNYEQIFNRQIQNMQVNNAIQVEKDIWNFFSGTIQAGTSGAMTGALVAGPWGALAGIGSMTMSAMAGGRDLALNQQLRNEGLDYTKDLFGYQLGNIRALPDAISKTTAYTANNKIFPFLEYYTCTDIEKKALEDKIKYNGMTVMRIGTIEEFIRLEPSYIKGQLIRIENFEEDFHILNEIANEINKGVFI